MEVGMLPVPDNLAARIGICLGVSSEELLLSREQGWDNDDTGSSGYGRIPDEQWAH